MKILNADIYHRTFGENGLRYKIQLDVNLKLFQVVFFSSIL